jgi:hypothetical protein
MHSFSIRLAMTLESVLRMQVGTPMAHSLRSPSNTTSYSAILFVHLYVSFVNCRHAAYLSLMPESDTMTVVAPAPVLLQAPSQYTCYGMLETGPSV